MAAGSGISLAVAQPCCAPGAAGLAAHSMAQAAPLVFGLGGAKGSATGWIKSLGGLDLAHRQYFAHPCSDS